MNALATTAPHVYEAIKQVMEALSKEGLSKSRKNESQGYKFRGIDDVLNILSSRLTEAGLLLLPSYSGHVVAEAGTAKSGSPIYRATVTGEFTFTSVKDGSSHSVRFPGEAFDSTDKATNKAMSAAYKYAALQCFCIPTEGDNDADASHLEVQKPTKNSGSPSTVATPPKNDYAKAIESASSMEDLLAVSKMLKNESEATKAAFRQKFKEKELKLGGG